MWHHLLETALLGTGKRQVNTGLIPPEIKDLTIDQTSDPEQFFLETAAFSCLYYEAGKLPLKIEGDLDNSEYIENKSVAPYKYNKIFEIIESLQVRLRENLCNLWLDNLITNNYLVSSQILIQLLFTGNNFATETKSKITKVIGNKGKWILSLHPDLKYEEIMDSIDVWTEGNTNERKSFLHKLLQNDPEEAIDMLRNTWETESMSSKKAFLDILIEYKDLSIIGFADTLYRGEFAFKPKEKKTEKECRKILVEILLGFEETLLHEETVSKLISYLNTDKKKGLLGIGSKSQINYQLPETEDSHFWNATNIEQNFGFETKNYDISLFKNINQYWLSCFLQILPSEIWIKVFEDSYQAFLNCFIVNEEFKIQDNGELKSVFFNPILQNAIKFNDNRLSVALLPMLSPINSIHVIKNLKPDEFEQYVKKNKLFADENILANGPYSFAKSWSFAFCNFVISNVYEMTVKGSAYNLSNLGIVIAQHIHIDSGNMLEEFTSRTKYTPYSQSWENCIYKPVSKVIQIKKLINPKAKY